MQLSCHVCCNLPDLNVYMCNHGGIGKRAGVLTVSLLRKDVNIRSAPLTHPSVMLLGRAVPRSEDTTVVSAEEQ